MYGSPGQLGGRIPVLDSLSELVARAESIPVWLDPLTRLEALVSDVKAWKESAAKTFLVSNSPYSLLEVGVLWQRFTGLDQSFPFSPDCVKEAFGNRAES